VQNIKTSETRISNRMAVSSKKALKRNDFANLKRKQADSDVLHTPVVLTKILPFRILFLASLAYINYVHV